MQHINAPAGYPEIDTTIGSIIIPTERAQKWGATPQKENGDSCKVVLASEYTEKSIEEDNW